MSEAVSHHEFIIIGAGLAGLAAASELRHQGRNVLVLDKSRGVGGRMATRRVGTLRMDHGAQFFTVRDPRFEALLAPLLTEGEVFEWSRGFPLWQSGVIHSRQDGHPRYACRSGMSALAKFMARDLGLALGDAVTHVERHQNGTWQILTARGLLYSAETLIVNAPPAQVLPLVGSFLDSDLHSRLSSFQMEPTWAVFGEVDRDPELGGVALEFADHPILGFMARDHSRRPEVGRTPSVVVHCNSSWSYKNLERSTEDVAHLVSNEVEKLFGVRFRQSPEVHRWRFAKPLHSLGEACLWDPQLRLGACGDWCTGGRVEGAVLSGWAAASKSSPQG